MYFKYKAEFLIRLAKEEGTTIMKKFFWIGTILFSLILILSEFLIIYWANSETNKESVRIEALNKSITGCLIVQKVYTLNQEKTSPPEIENPSSSDKANPSFPGYIDTILQQDDDWITISDANSLLVLVNKDRKFPDGFKPKQLIEPEVRFSFDSTDEKRKLRAVAALALEDLFESAEKKGHILYAVSGYRSYERQVSVHNTHIASLGKEKALEVSAFPGSSEHQSGLAMDISSQSVNYDLTTEFGNTPEGLWVKENAHKHGFIIRYPEDKTTVTGYSYEPWHLRYVGVEYASFLYENHLTLEEAIK